MLSSTKRQFDILAGQQHNWCQLLACFISKSIKRQLMVWKKCFVQILNITFKTKHSMLITLILKFEITRTNILPKKLDFNSIKPLKFNKVLNTTSKRRVAYSRKPLAKDIFIKIRQPLSSSHQKHP